MASRLFSRSLKTLSQMSRPMLVHTVTKFQPINIRMISVSASKLSGSSVYSDLTSFLSDEIKIEKEARKQLNKASGVKGFEVKSEGAEVTLTKTFNNET